jgi:hypothetical protein
MRFTNSLRKLSDTLIHKAILMETLKRLFYFLLGNALTVTCLYFGAYKGIPGFMNVLSFIIWFMFIVYLLTFLNEKAQKSVYLSGKKSPVPTFFANIISICYILVLVFYGHIFLGSLYIISLFLFTYMKDKGKELLEQNKVSLDFK